MTELDVLEVADKTEDDLAVSISGTTLNSPSVPTSSPTSMLEDLDLKNLKNYICSMEQALLRGESKQEETYVFLRKRLTEYLLTEATSPDKGSEMEAPVTFKNTILPTYALSVSNTHLADQIFSPETSSKIIQFIIHPTYVNLHQLGGTISLILVLLALFNVIPAYYLGFISLYTLSFLFNCLSLNLEILYHVLKSFDFWYYVTQTIIWLITFCLILPGYKILYPIFFWINSVIASLSDAMPPVYRKQMVPGYLFGSIFGLAVIICVHFHFYPGIHDYDIKIAGMSWGIRQAFETASVNLIIYIVRYGTSFFYFSPDVLLLKMNVKRVGKNV